MFTQVLVGFGPTFLLIGLPVFMFRKGAAEMGAGLTRCSRRSWRSSTSSVSLIGRVPSVR